MAGQAVYICQLFVVSIMCISSQARAINYLKSMPVFICATASVRNTRTYMNTELVLILLYVFVLGLKYVCLL